MKRVFLSTIAAVAAFAAAPTAQAAAFIPGDAQFTVSGDPASGPVSAYIGNTVNFVGNFTDTYNFFIDQNGFGSGSVTTTTTLFGSKNDLDIFSVLINGKAASKVTTGGGRGESFSIFDVPIISGVQNVLTVIGQSRGNGSYGGEISFLPSAVPESSTWAMMLIGFGAMGVAMRYRRRTTNVSFA